MLLLYRISIIISFLLSMLACGTFSGEDKNLAVKYLQVGSSQLESGSYPQALATLLKAESLDPENPVIQNNLGLAYFVRDHFDEAISHIQKAIEIKSDYSDAYNNIGKVYLEMGDHTNAIINLEKALSDLTYTSPEKPLVNLGTVYFKLKNYKRAEVYFEKALSLHRENCLAHTYLGRCFYEEKKYDKASLELDRATGFCQKSGFDEPQYYAGISYFELGSRDKAIARLENLIKLYPSGKYAEKARSMLEIMKR